MSLESRVKKLEGPQRGHKGPLLIVYADAEGGFVRYNGEDITLYYDAALTKPFHPETFKDQDIWCICRDIAEGFP